MTALPASFMERVEVTETCWNWLGGKVGRGYGAYRVDGVQRPAHRVAYEALVRPVDPALDLDHLCRNRACVNPAHLEPVTRRENLLRSPITLTALKAAQTECVNGHEFTPENTFIRSNGTRRCRICKRERDQARKARKRAA